MASGLRNTEGRYGEVAVLLHWAMALLLLSLLALGWYMARLPDVGFDQHKITLVLLHKSLGMAALTLAAVRLGWRMVGVLPRLEASIPPWQQFVARFVHLCFYALMFAVPLTGWLMSSAGGFPVYLFVYALRIPDLMGLDPWLFELLMKLHRVLAYALAALVPVHAGAALAHHLLWRDDTLRKMLP